MTTDDSESFGPPRFAVASLLAALDYPESPPPIGRGGGRISRRYGQGGIQEVADRPDATGNAERDRWRGPQGFMHAAEIVMADVERHGRRMVLKLLAECVRQPRETPRRHAD